MPDPARLDVDARFLLANERTLLAWVRTSLTLLLAGAGVQQFGDDVHYRSVLALLLGLLGTTAAVAGAVRYLRADRALRSGRLPAVGRFPAGVAFAVALVGLGLVAAVALDR